MLSLQQAVELVKSGQKRQARQALAEIARAAPDNLPAWFWLVETFESDAQRVKVLEECFKYNPERQEVRQALDKLRARLPDAAQKDASTPDQNRVEGRQAVLSSRPVPLWLWLAIAANAALFVALAAIGGAR